METWQFRITLVPVGTREPMGLAPERPQLRPLEAWGGGYGLLFMVGLLSEDTEDIVSQAPFPSPSGDGTNRYSYTDNLTCVHTHSTQRLTNSQFNHI